ncbi:MAG: hypothetical protein NVS4B8_10660 [Herpetosiphon sp.]
MTLRQSIALQFAQRSDTGRARRTNDDTASVEEYVLANGETVVVAAIADGVASSRAGKDASKLAVEAVQAVVRARVSTAVPHADEWLGILTESIHEANRVVLVRSKAEPRFNGMGTTLLVTVVAGRRALIAHVGDCRAYVIRPAVRRPHILQLTGDHTVAAQLVTDGLLSYDEAHDHPQRHMLARVIGIDDEVVVEVTARSLRLTERLLLCSDGLVLHLSDSEIARAVADAPTPQAACDILIDHANAKGGRDNVSAVVISLASPATIPTIPTS